MSIIVSVLATSFGIAYQGEKCAELAESSNRFDNLTRGNGKLKNIVVMGYNTYKNIVNFPLPNRYNVVISRRHLAEISSTSDQDNIFLASFVELEDFLTRFKRSYNEVWYIGGAEIYRQAIQRGLVKYVYVTEFECRADAVADRFFDKSLMRNARLVYTNSIVGTHCSGLQKTYELSYNRAERSYLSLLKRLLQQPLRSTRNGSTRALFAETLCFDLHQNGFPLMTTKRMPTKSKIIEKELLFSSADKAMSPFCRPRACTSGMATHQQHFSKTQT